MRIASAGHAVFAAALIGLGMVGLHRGEFAGVWQPVPKDPVAREALAYLCALISLTAGAGLLGRRTSAPAARGLLGYLLLWMLLFRVRDIVRAPGVEGYWSGAGETAVVVAATWVLYARFAGDWDRKRLGFATGERGLRIARIFYGLALIPFGLAHFIYAKETATLVPAWLSGHMAWAYFTGFAFLAAGAGVLSGICARLAAVLAALEVGLFTLLVWAPVMAAGSKDVSAVSETVISVVLTAAGWVVADSYREMSWLGGAPRTSISS